MTMIKQRERVNQINPQYFQQEDWDFKDSDTKEFTHCFHNYPAMMIPQIPRRLLYKYGALAKTLLDPYCGTGTSFVEANLQNINAIGTDLNPLARLIAKAKTTSIDFQVLNFYLNEFNDYIHSQPSLSIKIPQFHNIDFWFNPKTKTKLTLIKQYIESIDRINVKKFFLIALSETIRESSLTKKSEFKLIRIPQHESFQPDSFKIIKTKLLRNKIGLLNYMRQKQNSASAQIYDFNTVDHIPQNIIPRGSIDVVITSPPYGDSRTTVAYGQYSRLACQWMGIQSASSIDKNLMGGMKYNTHGVFDSDHLKVTLEKIDQKDSKRRLEVESFFIDYRNSINNISQVLKKKGIVCYVVGNRTVKGITIPTDLITKDFFENNGLRHIETITRNIPHKRMPSKNSPSNISGQTETTMKNEFIIICEKP